MNPIRSANFFHHILRDALATIGLITTLFSPAHAIAPTIMDGPHLPWAFVILIVVLLFLFKK